MIRTELNIEGGSMFLTLRGFTLSGIVLMGVGIFVTFGTETRRASAQTGESGDTATVEYFSGTSRYRIAKNTIQAFPTTQNNATIQL